jgi:hypothetical protein
MYIILANYLPGVTMYCFPVVVHHIYTKVKALAHDGGEVWQLCHSIHLLGSSIGPRIPLVNPLAGLFSDGFRTLT